MADLGTITYTAVTWTAGDVITEAKLDSMVANDQAYDSHSAQGLLLDNDKAYCAKDTGGTARNLLKINSSNEVVVGFNNVGWTEAGETWSYASADAPTYVITVPSDATTKYSAGMRLKLTHGGSTKYFIVTAVAETTLTLYGGTDYTLADTAITSPYYSTQKAPLGFPLDPNKWSVKKKDATERTATSVSANTWTNVGNTSIDIPIGVWNVSHHVSAAGQTSESQTSLIVSVTLSTANNSESDNEFTTSYTEVEGPAMVGLYAVSNSQISKAISLASKTTYYLNMKATRNSNLIYKNNYAPLVIRATCAYL